MYYWRKCPLSPGYCIIGGSAPSPRVLYYWRKCPLSPGYCIIGGSVPSPRGIVLLEEVSPLPGVLYYWRKCPLSSGYCIIGGSVPSPRVLYYWRKCPLSPGYCIIGGSAPSPRVLYYWRKCSLSPGIVLLEEVLPLPGYCIIRENNSSFRLHYNLYQRMVENFGRNCIILRKCSVWYILLLPVFITLLLLNLAGLYFREVNKWRNERPTKNVFAKIKRLKFKPCS